MKLATRARNSLAKRYLGIEKELLGNYIQNNHRRELLNQVYPTVWRWHGTGRFQHSDGGIKDVWQGILKQGGLVPHLDLLDPSAEPTASISTSPSRMYSSIYAKLYCSPGKSLENELGNPQLWAYYFLSHLVYGITKDYLQGVFSKEQLDQFWNQRMSAGYEQWRQKITDCPLDWKTIFKVGTDIPDNYPILIGIKDSAYQEARISPGFLKHERRSHSPIPIEDFTHIEVPQENIYSTEKSLKQYGFNLPILPIELGEKHCRYFNFSVLTGEERFKSLKENQVLNPQLH